MNEIDIEKAAALMRSASNMAVLTGAGVSKESGIPTFRDAQTGLWAKYDPQQLASPEGFKNNPELVWQWYDMRRQNLANVQPNAAHIAISALESEFSEFAVLTQNVDGLHQRAGSKHVVELHGNITTFYCFDRLHPASEIPTGLKQPPVCHCGSLIRPAVVWFGEALDRSVWRSASQTAIGCEVMLVVGTSALVQPAASLPFDAKQKGAKIIEINPEQTPLTRRADLFIQAPAAIAFPLLMQYFRQS
ncbi:MAG: NAD-dependent deacylase [Candidatus Obscuribacterales bacterium]|nr:NAD-dependent deacylase [Candidatus Obscuribacterales bacterium]